MTASAEPVEPGEPGNPAELGEPGEPAEPEEAAQPAELGWSGSLPEVVRLRVVALASDALGALGDDEVPASLRPFRRWAPARRTKLAATPLAAAVEHDVLFRQRCGTRLREAMPDLVAALEAETVPAAADPIDVAAAAYLLRSPGWPTAHQRGRRPPHASHGGGGDVAGGRDARPAAGVAGCRSLAGPPGAGPGPRGAGGSARRDRGGDPRAAGGEGARRRAERAAAEADVRAAEASAAAAAATSAADTELRRMRARLAEAEAAVESARRATRDGRSAGTPGCGCCSTPSSTRRRGCAGSWPCRRPPIGRPTWWRPRRRARRPTGPRSPCSPTTPRCSTSCSPCRRCTSSSTATT